MGQVVNNHIVFKTIVLIVLDYRLSYLGVMSRSDVRLVFLLYKDLKDKPRGLQRYNTIRHSKTKGKSNCEYERSS